MKKEITQAEREQAKKLIELIARRKELEIEKEADLLAKQEADKCNKDKAIQKRIQKLNETTKEIRHLLLVQKSINTELNKKIRRANFKSASNSTYSECDYTLAKIETDRDVFEGELRDKLNRYVEDLKIEVLSLGQREDLAKVMTKIKNFKF
ncbi:MAG TPA: hypothetical protein VGB37_15535 [Candidatus Lokiarchaeia archaeon]